jgi:Fe-S oxidoreductase
MTLELALRDQVAEILDRCTRCGACAEVCPMPAPAGLDMSDPQALTGGILTLLRGGTDAEASRWAAVCSGSGHCIPVCQHGVNPRLMLALARVADLGRDIPPVRRQTAFSRFGAMTKGVRVLSRLQLPPETLALFSGGGDDGAAPEVVF